MKALENNGNHITDLQLVDYLHKGIEKMNKKRDYYQKDFW